MRSQRVKHLWTALVATCVLVACAAIALAPPAHAEGGTWPPLGQMGWGRPYRVAVDGGYAYAAARSALTVIDVSAPSQPLGCWDDPRYARGVAVSGGYAYVAEYSGGGGLSVVDVADAAHPVEAGFCDTPGSSEEDVAVSGSYAYVVGGAGLTVVDVSDPTHPVATGNLPLAPGDKALSVDLSGSYAYIGTRTCVARIDISNPATPVLVGSVATPGQCWGVAVSGDYAYAAVYDQGMWVFDMANFTPVGSLPTTGYDMDVGTSGSYAYVGTNAAEGGMLRVVNVSDPAHPSEVTHCDIYRNIYGVTLADGLAYVASDWAGVQIVDVSDPESPAEVAYSDTNGGSREIVVFGSHVYTMGSRGLRVTDVSNPTDPVATSYSDPREVGAACLAASGTYLYVGGHVGGDTLATGVPTLRVMGLSDPAHPAQAGSCALSDFPGGLAVSGGYAYAGCQNGLSVINVSNPASPAEVAFLPISLIDNTVAVAVIGEYAYVAGYSRPTLWVVNVSTPATPVLVGSWTDPAPIYGLDPIAGYLCVSDRSGVRVMDVTTNPASPAQVAYWPMPGTANQVAVAGTYAYVTHAGVGLRILDLSEDPVNPTEVAYWNTAGDGGGVVAAGGYVYLGDYRWGLLVFPQYGRVVSAPDLVACPGSTLAVPISVNEAQGVAAAQIDLRYDSAILTATSVEPGELIAGNPHWQLVSQITSGRTQALIYNDQAVGLPDGAGTLVKVNFQVNPLAVPGSSTVLELRKHILSDWVGNELISQPDDGSVQIIGVHHFAFAPISSPQGADPVNPLPFSITIRALDQNGEVAAQYAGSPTLSDLTATVQPTTVGPFVSGIWTGDVTVGAAQAADVLHVADGTAAGDSNAFDVIAKGSADGNQEVNVLDVMKVVNIILGNMTPDPWQFWAADMNSDGMVNVQDIILIINEIFSASGMGQPVNLMAQPVKTMAQPSRQAVVVDTAWSTSAAGNPLLTIKLSNAVGMAGAQLDVSYKPKRVRSVSVKAGSLISAANWSVYGKDLGGTYRVLAYSPTAQGLSASKGALVQLKFVATARKNFADLTTIVLTDGAGKRMSVRIR